MGKKNSRIKYDVLARITTESSSFLSLNDAARVLVANALVAPSQGQIRLYVYNDDADPVRPFAPIQQLNLLEWLGLKTECVHEMTENYPHTLSRRKDTYQEYFFCLYDALFARCCFCSVHLDDALCNSDQLGESYCEAFTPENLVQHLEEGGTFVARFNTDRLRRRVGSQLRDQNVRDFVLITADGMASPYFAHVVDAIDFGVTLDVRASATKADAAYEEYLYAAFGANRPAEVFVPNIIDVNARTMFEDASIDALQAQGFVPQAIIHYLAQLLWPDLRIKPSHSVKGLLAQVKGRQPTSDAIYFNEAHLYEVQQYYVTSL
ncbi:MAG: hypothetical protein H6670_09020 [Anaerolineaceae bacterium]|nr:hypothetical protein [Anaerolineaceae bacterium]